MAKQIRYPKNFEKMEAMDYVLRHFWIQGLFWGAGMGFLTQCLNWFPPSLSLETFVWDTFLEWLLLGIFIFGPLVSAVNYHSLKKKYKTEQGH